MRLYVCHCTDCQVLSGSAFRLSVPVINDSFRFVSGVAKTHVKTAASGNKRVLAFCPECGTSVYSRPEEGKAGYFGLRVGSLRQRCDLVPVVVPFGTELGQPHRIPDDVRNGMS